MNLTRSLVLLPSLLLLLVCGPDPAPEPTPDVTGTSHTDEDPSPPSKLSGEMDDDTAYAYNGELTISSRAAIGSCTLPDPGARKYKKISVHVVSGAVTIHSCSSLKLLKQQTEGMTWRHSGSDLNVVFDDPSVIVNCDDLPGGNSECKVEPFCIVGAADKPEVYKYTIEVAGAMPLDPHIIIDP